ncbi:PspC domain-containing protein [Sinomonas gamaensis]|jgi:phage shock protein PspC (stress-responsive transcriptional regulator)|uniref:PspC domain-containing protein n=1 Tax=Sinomonas gamaensis TaxID=2565624 RepID=UPI001108ABEF|nr:PspC domain-containing protein [Sinomonas gamaensis]
MDSFFNAIRSTGLRRSQRRLLAGVLGGVAEKLGVDVAFVRIVFIVLCFLPGPAILAYLVAWALIPDPNGSIILEKALGGPRGDAGHQVSGPGGGQGPSGV